MTRSMKWEGCFVILVLISTCVHAKITCRDALEAIFPCEDFLLGFDGEPSAECCAGMQSLDKIANASHPDHITICQCFKNAAQHYPMIDLTNAKRIPELCGLSTVIVIDPNINCNRI